MPDFALIYARFRGSKSFLAGLTSFIAIWLSFHFEAGFDADFGMLNTVLSTEASLSLAFFTMVSERQGRAQQKQAEAMAKMIADLHTMAESSLSMVEGQKCVLDEITRSLKTRQLQDHAQVDQLTR